ncbi:MAG: YqgE/AlgH family protein [Deltaproteobacteria bacterium]|nr:YqgE/AlgH family protein [Deltaproteobacteria bacterium]
MPLDTLAPGLLLAASHLRDGHFDKRVILLARCDSEGALGWVINGPSAGSVRSLLASTFAGELARPIPDSPAFAAEATLGGPVSTSSGWLLYRTIDREPPELPGEISVGPGLVITNEVAAFRRVLAGESPQAFRLLLGYAGWAPGQLESEISRGSWLPCELFSELAFATGEAAWDAAYQRAIGRSAAAFVGSQRGSA